jgi:hypothetical protein
MFYFVTAATIRKILEYLRFKFFTSVTILNMFVSVKAPCGLVDRSQRFGEAYCLHLQG